MSAIFCIAESMFGEAITVEDLLYFQLDQANKRASDMNRAELGSQPWMEAKRKYELAIEGARLHAETLRHERYRWSELIDQLMRAHNV